MDGSIRRSATDRKNLFEVDRRGTDPEELRRAHILLLLGNSVAWAVVVEVLYTSTVSIDRWRRRYLHEGVGCNVGRGCWPASVREWRLAADSTLSIEMDVYAD